MSTLLSSLGRWSFRHPWRVLVAWLLVLGVVGGGALLLQKGTDNTFTIPGTESQAGLEQLTRSFPQVSGTNAQFIVVAADGDSLEDAAYREPIEDAVTDLERIEGVLAVTSPYGDLVDGMIADGGTAAIVQLQFEGQSTEVPDESKDELSTIVDDMAAQFPEGSETKLGGDLFAMSIPGVTITEAVGLLIALIVLIVSFRSFVMAGMPLLTAVLGVGISIAGIFAATAFSTISSTTPLLALMLGLAVGIDYALFIMARHQDQLREGMTPEESAARAVGTAGSAVVFAGVTVLIALIGLSFAGIPFLTTMGIAASVAVAIAVAIAVTLTPAVLGFIGAKAIGRPKRAKRAKTAARAADTVKTNTAATATAKPTNRWVAGITRRPILTSLAVIVGLVVVAIPALSLNLALPNAGVLDPDDEARQSYDLVAEHFGPGFNGPLILTGTIITSTDPLGLMEDIGDAVAEIDGVERVALATPNETADTGIVQIVPTTAPDDPATSDLVRELRTHTAEWQDEFGVELKVTGFTAVAIDISDQLGAALLPFGVFVIGLSLILLTIVFRSIWVPITAAAGYLLSIIAAFGIVAAVFELGWFAELLHVAKTGPIISFMPIILMGVLFGLAMDYQVFLVSRMREDYVHALRRAQAASGAPLPRDERRAIARAAVRSGFTGSAKVVTAAALIMFAVFVAFVPEGDSSLKPIALGLAAGIAIDAFLVRMTLVPALLAILGERAWEIPAWLERILPSVDIEGEAVERERHLAEWPGDGAAIAADRLELGSDAAPLTDLSLRVAPGQALVATGRDAATRRLLALTVAGRVPVTAGDLRVAGHLLPGRDAWVRSHVGCVLVGDDQTEALAQLREALRGRTSVIVIDGVDAFTGAARDQAAAMLRDASTGSAQATDDALTVFATASDAEAAGALLSEAGWTTPALQDVSSASRTAPTSEVNA